MAAGSLLPLFYEQQHHAVDVPSSTEDLLAELLANGGVSSASLYGSLFTECSSTASIGVEFTTTL